MRIYRPCTAQRWHHTHPTTSYTMYIHHIKHILACGGVWGVFGGIWGPTCDLTPSDSVRPSDGPQTTYRAANTPKRSQTPPQRLHTHSTAPNACCMVFGCTIGHVMVWQGGPRWGRVGRLADPTRSQKSGFWAIKVENGKKKKI